MDIYDFALKMEKDGEAFYRDLAKSAPAPGVAAIFTLLAGTEKRHYDIVLKLKNAEPAVVEDSGVFAGVRTLFEEMAAKGTLPAIDPDATDAYVDLYRQAQRIEVDTLNFYLEKGKQLPAGHAREALAAIADEERRHICLLENIIGHVSRPDFTWIEFAEWHHKQEY